MHVFYHDSQTILVVNPKGKMRKLYVPFRVVSNENGSWVYVNEVGTNKNDELIYFINGNQYPHSLFQIRIKF
jgi:hypothetical protein